MPDLAPGSGTSLLRRITENLDSIRKLPRDVSRIPLAANAPLHLLDTGPNASIRSHIGATGLHAVLCAAVILALMHSPNAIKDPSRIKILSRDTGVNSLPELSRAALANLLGHTGNSGGPDSVPPTKGNLLPQSRLVIAQPTLPDSHPHILSIRQAVYDPDAPEIVPIVSNPGLPWMTDPNGSRGKGEHGIGVGDKTGMGDKDGDGSGVGNQSGPYAIAASQVACKVCPDPAYSDEARKTKLQGHVVLRVLVGADGRAKEIQLAHGLGLGLDENAIAAVRHWQFIPARGAAGRPIPSWIMIETVFRLF